MEAKIRTMKHFMFGLLIIGAIMASILIYRMEVMRTEPDVWFGILMVGLIFTIGPALGSIAPWLFVYWCQARDRKQRR